MHFFLKLCYSRHNWYAIRPFSCFSLWNRLPKREFHCHLIEQYVHCVCKSVQIHQYFLFQDLYSVMLAYSNTFLRWGLQTSGNKLFSYFPFTIHPFCSWHIILSTDFLFSEIRLRKSLQKQNPFPTYQKEYQRLHSRSWIQILIAPKSSSTTRLVVFSVVCSWKWQRLLWIPTWTDHGLVESG